MNGKSLKDRAPFEVADHGRNFSVLLFDDVVVKVPKRSKIRNQLNEIVAKQNELATEVDGVLPCEVVEDAIVMPRAPGVRADELTGKEAEQAKRDFNRIKSEAENAGYQLRGNSERNYFWDGEQSYAVDFSHVDSS